MIFVTKENKEWFWFVEKRDLTISSIAKEYGDEFTVTFNFWWNENVEDIQKAFGCSLQEAKEIASCYHEVIIYDHEDEEK